VWERIFFALTGSSAAFTGSMDSPHIEAHCLTAGARPKSNRGPSHKLLPNRAHDATSLRDWLAARGTEPVIQPNHERTRAWDRDAYPRRNFIERMFCRLNGLQRIVERHDKRADIFLAAVYLTAVVTW
jgi:transposase